MKFSILGANVEFDQVIEEGASDGLSGDGEGHWRAAPNICRAIANMSPIFCGSGGKILDRTCPKSGAKWAVIEMFLLFFEKFLFRNAIKIILGAFSR